MKVIIPTATGDRSKVTTASVLGHDPDNEGFILVELDNGEVFSIEAEDITPTEDYTHIGCFPLFCEPGRPCQRHAKTCTVCTSTWTCISHTCPDCGRPSFDVETHTCKEA